MYIFRRLISCVLISALVSILFVACSKSNVSEAISTKAISTGIESWIGDYSFEEYAPPNMDMLYDIKIIGKNGKFHAIISIDGFQTIQRLEAKVSGDEKAIKLLFYKYLQDNKYEPYKKGDILLSLKYVNSNICTYWGKLQPMLSSNKSGKVYFIHVKQ